MLMSAPVAGRPLLSISTQGINLEPQAGFFRLAIRPRPGNNRATVLVRDRGRGGSRTLRVSVWVRARTEPGPFVTIEPESVDFGHVEPSDREPASVGQARTRRRWVSVVAMLLVATIGVLGAWVSRPRSREAQPEVDGGEPKVGGQRLLASHACRRLPAARCRSAGAARDRQTVNWTSLSKSGSFDDTEKRWLRDARLRRALMVKFTHSKAGRRLEVRIFEVRDPMRRGGCRSSSASVPPLRAPSGSRRRASPVPRGRSALHSKDVPRRAEAGGRGALDGRGVAGNGPAVVNAEGVAHSVAGGLEGGRGHGPTGRPVGRVAAEDDVWQ